MSIVADAIEQVRKQTQHLYKKIDESTSHRNAVGGDLKTIASEATLLASSVKRLAQDQRAGAQVHLQKAAARLTAAGIAGATLAETREHMRDALQNISQAVAEVRHG